MFKKAVKQQSRLRLAIAGPSGSGKTYTALAIATAMSDKVALLDTEHGSASKYADIFDFDVLEMEAPFHPDRFGNAIKIAQDEGYEILIIDSLSHAWSGPGGLLEIVDELGKRQKSRNSFTAWKDATPIQNRLVENLLAADLHIIATMRSKQEYVMEQDDKGRTIVRKVGMAPVQRDSFEYEFDVFLDMDIENNAIVQKTRCPALTGRVFAKPGKDIANILMKWLQGEPSTNKNRRVRQVSKPQADDEPEDHDLAAIREASAENMADALTDFIIWFRERAKEERAAVVSQGWQKSIRGKLSELANGDREQIIRFLSRITGREIKSSNDLKAGEWAALKAWLNIVNVTGEDGKKMWIIGNKDAKFTFASHSK